MVGLVRDKTYAIIERVANPDKNWVIDKLETDVCLVVFRKKVNGQFRSLKCTRSLSLLPRKYKPSFFQGIENPHGYENIIPVWDIFSREWKSFYLESVTTFTVLLGENTKKKKVKKD